MMFTLIVLLAAVCGSAFAEECKALGEAIYIPSKDLVSTIPNGVKIFKDLPDNCIEKRRIGNGIGNIEIFENTCDIYKSITISTHLGASFQSAFSLGVTLDAISKKVGSKERNISGASLYQHQFSFEKFIHGNCFLEPQFIDGFESEFKALETAVDKPWKRESWRKYDGFMKKYGSHIISGIVYGSSVVQYVFAQSNKKYSQRDFIVNACAKLAGPAGPGSLSVKACANVSSSEVKATNNMAIEGSILVKGGKPETQSKIQAAAVRTPELIEQFLTEGTSDPGPIKIYLKPIWEIMRDFYSKDDEIAEKAMNMEYYFQGYLSYGCKHKTEGNIDLQKFTQLNESTPGRPIFECSIAPEGCHDDDDCHCTIKGCSCKGKTCVQYKKSTQNTGTSRIDAEINDKENWKGQNGCKFSFHTKRGRVCKCKEEKTDRVTVWSSSSLSDAITTKNEVSKYKLQGGILHP